MVGAANADTFQGVKFRRKRMVRLETAAWSRTLVPSVAIHCDCKIVMIGSSEKNDAKVLFKVLSHFRRGPFFAKTVIDYRVIRLSQKPKIIDG